jgi:phosphatidate cytidylyltransferase
LSTFLRRTLTAFWIVVFILGGFWLHPVSFYLTGLVIIAGGQYEYYRMIRKTGAMPQTITGMITGIALYSISTLVAAGLISKDYYLILLPLSLGIMITELYRNQDKPFNSIAHTFFGVFYIAFPFSLFPYLAFSRTGIGSLLPHGMMVFSPGLVVGFMLILWANDTGAYLTGAAFGRHRLMERISPKKSWEGCVGGALISVLAAWLISGWLGTVSVIDWIVIALLISITGTFGDLIESMLKRSAGVKDSGKIMPGHGGFLDRFDSTLVSFPFVFLFVSLFG